MNTSAELTLLGTSMVMLIIKAQEAKRKQPGIDLIFLKPLQSQVRRAEVKVTSFIVEHNIPLVVADHLGPFFIDIFHDSMIAKNYTCGKTKTTCILNRAIKLKLQKKFDKSDEEGLLQYQY